MSARDRETASMWAIVPVKAFSGAKQRLAPVLSASARAELARHMATDVLAALAQVALPGMLVVTHDLEVERIARQAGADVLVDRAAGHTAAAALASAQLAARGARHGLILSADLPLAAADEIRRLLRFHRALAAERKVTLVTDRRRDGTNALVVSPPDALRFAFGADSLARHRAAAADAGLEVQLFEAPGLALDIDLPEDLALLARAPGRSRSGAWLCTHRARSAAREKGWTDAAS